MDSLKNLQSFIDSSLISYSQCLEDIVLYKLLSSVARGYYVDIGCGNPIYDNVGKFFYDKGWRGINVDALEHMLGNYAKERPDDITLNLGISDRKGKLTFFVHGGISTFDIDTKTRMGHVNWEIRTVDVITLTDLLDLYAANVEDIHFLKLDVEHHEKHVIAGMDFTKYRPWVISIESTLPCTKIPSWHEWEAVLFANGYKFFLMHDVMRYYIAHEHLDECKTNWSLNALLSYVPFVCVEEINIGCMDNHTA